MIGIRLQHKILGFAAILLLSVMSYAAPVVFNTIAAVVNNDIITMSQLQTQVALAKRQMQAQKMTLPSESVLQQQVLDMMINQSLQLQVAKRVHMTISEQEFQGGLEQIASSQNISVSQLLEAVSQQGISPTEFRAQLKDQMLVSKLQRALIAPQIKISPIEIETYVKSIKKQDQGMQYHLEDLLIPLPNVPTPQEIAAATKRAKKFIAEVNAGQDFKSLAAAQSSGKNALQGGDLGWQSLAELPAVFSTVVQSLEVGQLSQPIRSREGIHVLLLVGVRSGSAEANQTNQEIADMLFKRQFEERLAAWIEQARESAYVKIFINK